MLRKITENVEKHSNTSMVEQQRGKGGDKHFRTEIGNSTLFYIQVKDCEKTPDILQLHYNNNYWQQRTTQNATFYLYSAFYDKRQEKT